MEHNEDETKTLSSELGFDYYDWSTLFDKTNATIFYDMVHFQKKIIIGLKC